MNVSETRPEWGISRRSFHWRLYQYWRRLGGGGPEAKGLPLNLCHYVRVVVFWVWLRWFFCSRFKPWAWTFAIAFGAINVYAAEHWHDAWITVWAWILTIACLLAVGAGLGWLVVRNDKVIERRLDQAWRWSRPTIISIGRSAFGLLGFRLWRWLRVWMVVGAFVVSTLLIFFPYATLNVLGTIALIALIFVGGIAAAVLLEFFKDRRRAKRDDVDEEVSQTKESLRLAKQFVVAKKRRICPLLTPED